MVASFSAYDEIINFIASGPSPSAIIAFRPSETTRQRVLDVLYNEKNAILSAEEKSELEHYLVLEHIFRMAKVRARRNLAA